jgi:hypothetical protein
MNQGTSVAGGRKDAQREAASLSPLASLSPPKRKTAAYQGRTVTMMTVQPGHVIPMRESLTVLGEPSARKLDSKSATIAQVAGPRSRARPSPGAVRHCSMRALRPS